MRHLVRAAAHNQEADKRETGDAGDGKHWRDGGSSLSSGKPAAPLIAQSIVGARDKKLMPGEEELWSGWICA